MESNVNREPAVSESEEEGGDGDGRKLPKELTQLFLVLGLIFLTLELLYIKLRGDI